MEAVGFVSGSVVAKRSAFTGRSIVSRGQAVKPTVARKSVITMVKSKAMPFMEAPPALDGSLPGDNGFDPLGFTRVLPVEWLAESEIKHGRICMLATVGFLVQELFTLPGSYFPKGMLAVDVHDYFTSMSGKAALGQLNLWISAWEVITIYSVLQTLDGKRAPGYFGFDPLGLAKTPEKMKSWANAEVINGRLAMCAIGGMVHQQWIYKQGTLYQLLHFKPMF